MTVEQITDTLLSYGFGANSSTLFSMGLVSIQVNTRKDSLSVIYSRAGTGDKTAVVTTDNSISSRPLSFLLTRLESLGIRPPVQDNPVPTGMLATPWITNAEGTIRWNTYFDPSDGRVAMQHNFEILLGGVWKDYISVGDWGKGMDLARQYVEIAIKPLPNAKQTEHPDEPVADPGTAGVSEPISNDNPDEGDGI